MDKKYVNLVNKKKVISCTQPPNCLIAKKCGRRIQKLSARACFFKNFPATRLPHFLHLCFHIPLIHCMFDQYTFVRFSLENSFASQTKLSLFHRQTEISIDCPYLYSLQFSTHNFPLSLFFVSTSTYLKKLNYFEKIEL